jgi:uncharacterized membrane protein (UPF0127 family)
MTLCANYFLEVRLKHTLINATKSSIIANKIIIADKFWTRMRGLIGRRDLKEDEGLLLAPCNAVHMMFMRFPIDVIFLDKDFIVVKIIENLKPWGASPIVRGSIQVIELGAGSVEKNGISTGDKLSLKMTG